MAVMVYVGFNMAYALSLLTYHREGLDYGPEDKHLRFTDYTCYNEYSQREVLTNHTEERALRVLLLTAHPDDEAMFFSPSLLALAKPYVGNKTSKIEFYLHCLSKGLNCGDVRKEELMKAAPLLNVPTERVFVDDLQDGAQWSDEEVSARLDLAIKRWKIDVLITFDDYGVSGHKNHISCHHGVKHYLCTAKPGLKIPTYILRSVPIYHKYLGYYRFPQAVNELGNFIRASKASKQEKTPHCSSLLLSNPNTQTTHDAMQAHASQYVWFRRLFIFFSQYVYYNTLDPLVC